MVAPSVLCPLLFAFLETVSLLSFPDSFKKSGGSGPTGPPNYGEDRGPQWAVAVAVGSVDSGGQKPGMILMGKEQCKNGFLLVLSSSYFIR
jgi:hypothetical protein